MKKHIIMKKTVMVTSLALLFTMGFPNLKDSHLNLSKMSSLSQANIASDYPVTEGRTNN